MRLHKENNMETTLEKIFKTIPVHEGPITQEIRKPEDTSRSSRVHFAVTDSCFWKDEKLYGQWQPNFSMACQGAPLYGWEKGSLLQLIALESPCPNGKKVYYCEHY